MLTFPKDNLTASCNNEILCYHNASCIKSTFAEYKVCNCPGYYNPLTRCQTTFFDAFKSDAYVYGIVGIIIYSFVLILFSVELVGDIMRKLRNLSMMSKAALIIFTILRLIHFSQWVYSAQYGMYKRLPLTDTVLTNVAFICLGSFGVLSVCIDWCGMLLRAKKLGDHSKTIRRIRITFIVLMCIVSPLASIFNIINNFNTTRSIFGYLSNIIGAVSVVIILATNGYVIYIVYKWISKMTKINDQSRSLAMVLNKTRWIIATHSTMTTSLLMAIFFLFIPRELPYWTLIIETTIKITELIAVGCLFGFLQSYLTIIEGKPFLGYLYIISGNRDKLKATEVNSTPTPGSKPKSGNITSSGDRNRSTTTTTLEMGTSE